jgi:Bacterial Ig domain/Divergent InlB B-repeat domain/Fibronectin type III domain
MGTAISIRSGVATRAWLGYAWSAVVACVAVVLSAAAVASGAMTTPGSYPPPATGPFAYNSFLPPANPGGAYTDPVFGETVRRVTADHGRDDIYARNMWWSADEKRYLHRTQGVPGKNDAWDVIDVATGVVTHTGVPFGSIAADGGFDPVDPNVLYYLVENRGDGHGEIHQVTLNPDGTWADVVYFTAPAAIGELGGSMNWLDAGGRYMLVRFGAEPSVHVYDRQNLAAGPYANPIDGRNYIDQGSYLGLSPDGTFVVGYDSRTVGYAGAGQGVSWQLDHANRALAAAPNVFWSLCGDHGSFLSASDGRNYMITYDCYSQAGLWRVDITNNAAGLNEAQQQSLPNNKLLLAHPTWSDFGHVSTVARGALRDWAFTSTEDSTDASNSGTADADGNIAPWHSYRQEIVAINVLTGEVRRLAHHRSRSMGSDYYSQPRLSASWGGAFVAFPSNFNRSGVVDIYAIPFGTTTGQNFSIAVSSNGSGSGTVSSSPDGIECGANCSGSYAGGTVLTLTAAPGQGSTFMGWGGACTGTGSCSVTMSADTAVTATFDASTSSTYTLTVAKAGTGSGTVASSPGGISCGTTCSATYASGFPVTLTATPASGSTFGGWSGACRGTGTCTVLANATTTAMATFNVPPPPVSVSITAPGEHTTVSSKVIVTADAAAGAGIANVQFKLDGNNLGGKDSTAPYTVFWDTTRSSNGSHTLTAVATNKAGVSATAATITITVMNPSISAVSASNVSSSGATIRWTTDEGSDSQVEYGTATGYGASTALNSARVTSHTQTLSGLAAGTLYHFRVRSRNASGNLAVSGDFTFTTGAAAVSGGGGSPQAVVWTGLVNATATANSLQKTSGCGGCEDAGGYSQQQIASANGYVQFTATEVASLRFVGLSRSAASTSGSGINFALRLQSGRAEVRESGTYRAETMFGAGDTFRITIESGVVKYSKNGTVFYTSGVAPVYPLQVDASLLDLGSTVGNAVISF